MWRGEGATRKTRTGTTLLYLQAMTAITRITRTGKLRLGTEMISKHGEEGHAGAVIALNGCSCTVFVAETARMRQSGLAVRVDGTCASCIRQLPSVIKKNKIFKANCFQIIEAKRWNSHQVKIRAHGHNLMIFYGHRR